MSLISPEVGKQIKQALSAMDVPVRLVLFTKPNDTNGDCEYCADTQQLMEEIAALEDKIQLEIHDLLDEKDVADAYQVDKVPAIIPLRDGTQPVDYGIRLYGIPAGYEFSAFIEDILMVSRGQHGLSDNTLRQIERLDRPVHIQVYTTPT
jgi:glutaredoxin-like protein